MLSDYATSSNSSDFYVSTLFSLLPCQAYLSIQVFHSALVVCAALQVYETKTALVKVDDCDGTFNYVVYRDAALVTGAFPDVLPLGLWRCWNIMGQSQTVAYCRTLRPFCILVLYVVFHQKAIRRIWVR